MPLPITSMHPAEQICPATTFVALSTGAIDPPTRYIYVAVAGTVTWTDLEGNLSSDVAMVAGAVLPVAIVDIDAITDAVLYGLK